MPRHIVPVVRPTDVNRGPLMTINSVTTSTCDDAADLLSHANFANVLQANVNVSHIQSQKCRTFSQLETIPDLGNVVSKKGVKVDSETLLKRWCIDRKKTLNTVRRTTQRDVRTCLHPSLSRRYPTNDRMLRYRRLPYPVFSDTLKAGGVVSTRDNKYAQAYCTRCAAHGCQPGPANDHQ